MPSAGYIVAALCAVALWLAGPAQAQDDASAPLAQVRADAESGQAEAQFAMGQRYHTGNDVPQDFAEAARWYALAAEQGHAPALNQLARYRHEGLGGPADPAEALRLFEAAAAGGEPAHLYDLGRVLEQDPDTVARAATLFARAAEAGHPDAAVNLGVLHQEGRGVAQDFVRARELYEEPAAQGNARALNNLGLLHVRGDGVPQDYARAAEYFAAAVDLGLPTAMTNLGVLYENGFGVPLDEPRARALYRAGGRREDPQAATGSGLIYDPRLHPVEMTEAALTALQARAQAADPVALFQLGWVLLQSQDAPYQARFRAAALFRAAADKGYGPAMANLGTLYFQGRGLPQDYVLGQMWILRARAAGVPQAGEMGDSFMQTMTADQINQAQAMARSADRATADPQP